MHSISFLVLSLTLFVAPHAFAETETCDEGSVPISLSKINDSLPLEQRLIVPPALRKKLETTTLCTSQGDIIIRGVDRPSQNLIYAGIYLGLPSIGADLSYFRLTPQGRMNFHVGLKRGTNLQVNITSLNYGYHPLGNALYYGGQFDYYSTGTQSGEKAIGFGPQGGINGGRSFITGNISAGGMLYFTNQNKVYATPTISFGFRIRLTRF